MQLAMAQAYQYVEKDSGTKYLSDIKLQEVSLVMQAVKRYN